MCRAVDKLTSDQREVFFKLKAQLEGADLTSALTVVDALRQHVELEIVCQRPYSQPRSLAFPSPT